MKQRRARPIEQQAQYFGDGPGELSSSELLEFNWRDRPPIPCCHACGGELPCARHVGVRPVDERLLETRTLVVLGVVSGFALVASLIFALLVMP